MNQLPEKVFSHYPPTLLQTASGKYVVFEVAGEWYKVDDDFTQEDAMKHWEAKEKEIPIVPEPSAATTPASTDIKRIAIDRWEKQSKSDKSKVYEVIKYDDDTYTCNCPSFIFKKEGQERNCKHIDEIKQNA
jgi:hypothetical protein